MYTPAVSNTNSICNYLIPLKWFTDHTNVLFLVTSFNTITIINMRSNNILEFPESILFQILHHVAYSSRGSIPKNHLHLPHSILPISTTCKLLRNISSRLISDDTLFDFNHGYQVDDPEAMHCPLLSDDPSRPSLPSPSSICENNPCRSIHRQIAWYKFSVLGLTTLHFIRICEYIPAGEAIDIINRLIAARTPISILDLSVSMYTSEEKINIMMPNFRRLLAIIASKMKKITIEPSMNGRELVFSALNAFPLPALTHVTIIAMDVSQWENSNQDIEVETVLEFLKHCRESGAVLQHLQLVVPPHRLAELSVVGDIYPVISELTITHMPVIQYDIEGAVHFDRFNPETINITDMIIGEEDIIDMARSFSENDRVKQVNFIRCKVLWLSKALHSYGLAFGNKIKRLVMVDHDEPDPKLCEAVATFCHNCVEADLPCYDEQLEDVAKFLHQSPMLESFFLRCPSELESEKVRKFIELLEGSGGRIKTFRIDGLGLLVNDVLNMMNHIGEWLECFHLEFQNALFFEYPCEGYNLKDAAELLDGLLKSNNMPMLKSVFVPLSNVPSEGEQTIEEKVLVQEIECLLDKLAVKYKSLELSYFECWLAGMESQV